MGREAWEDGELEDEDEKEEDGGDKGGGGGEGKLPRGELGLFLAVELA